MFPQWFLEVLGSAAASSVLVGILVYLFQSVLTERLKAAVKSEYDEKLESHKAQLAAANSKELEILKAQLKGHSDAELEHFKSKLQVQALQQSTRFAKLHERRLEAIAQVHEHLLAVQEDLSFYIDTSGIAGGPSRDEKLQKLGKTYERFRDCYRKGHIFLPRDVVQLVGQIESEFRRISNQYTLAVLARADEVDEDLGPRLNADLVGHVGDTLGSLQEAMRTALGDEPVDEAVVNS